VAFNPLSAADEQVHGRCCLQPALQALRVPGSEPLLISPVER
jgi:hypothetical protein